MLIHHAGHAVARSGVYLLYAPRDGRAYIAHAGGACRGADAAVKRGELIRHVVHRGEHGAHVDRGEKRATVHLVAGADADLLQLHSGGYLQLFHIVVAQPTGAVDGCAYAAAYHLRGAYLRRAAAAELLSDALSQIHRPRRYHNRGDGGAYDEPAHLRAAQLGFTPVLFHFDPPNAALRPLTPPFTRYGISAALNHA